MIPVKNYSYLYRDENTSAILNLDDASYQHYIKSKESALETQRKIECLQSELSEIKELLKDIIRNK